MATLTAPRKTGGKTVSTKTKSSAGGFDVAGRLRGLIGALKTSLVPLALAVIAVAVASRWGKRDDKGKPTIMFPFTATAIAWLVPELIMQGVGRRGFGGLVTQSSLRMAGAFAFLLALTFDEILGPVARKAAEGATQTGNFVARVFWWAGDLMGGHDATRQFVMRSPALPSAPGAAAPQPQPQPQPSSYEDQYDTFSDADYLMSAGPQPQPAPQPQQPVQQQPAPQQPQMSDTAAITSAIFGFLGQAAQAAPGIITAFTPQQQQQQDDGTNPGGNAGLAHDGLMGVGRGDPYRLLAGRRAA